MGAKNYLVLLAIMLVMNGCSCCKYFVSPEPSATICDSESNLIKISDSITDVLLDNLNTGVTLNKEAPILIASFVDVNDVQSSSSFGRMIADYLNSRFTKKGYTVLEIKLRDHVYVKEAEGELLLSRRIHDIYKNLGAQAVVVGTYLKTKDNLYINGRIVKPDTRNILSSCDLKLAFTDDLKSLFWYAPQTTNIRDEYFVPATNR